MDIKILDRDKWNLINDYMPVNLTDSIYDDADVLVAMEDKEVIGAMLVREQSQIAQIIYISVADDYRQQGVCTRLVSEYMLRCINSSVVRISTILGSEEYDVYVYKTLIRFGFVLTSADKSLIKITVKEFMDAELVQLSNKGRIIMSFKDLGNEGIKQAAKAVRTHTGFDFSDSDFINGNKELSFAIITDGIIKDVILLRDRDDYLEAACMYSSKDDAYGAMRLLKVVQDKFKNMPEYANKEIIIPSINEASKKIVAHLVPDCRIEMCGKMEYNF